MVNGIYLDTLGLRRFFGTLDALRLVLVVPCLLTFAPHFAMINIRFTKSQKSTLTFSTSPPPATIQASSFKLQAPSLLCSDSQSK